MAYQRNQSNSSAFYQGKRFLQLSKSFINLSAFSNLPSKDDKRFYVSIPIIRKPKDGHAIESINGKNDFNIPHGSAKKFYLNLYLKVFGVSCS